MKKRINFFELLSRQCEYMTKGMSTLYQYCLTTDKSFADAIFSIEDEGDMVRRVLIDELNKTFVTPIDRQDLFDLSRLLDEILDYAKTTVDEILLFSVTPNEEMCAIVKVLCDMTAHISTAVQNIEKHKAISRDEAIKVKEIENEVSTMTNNVLASLFDNADFRTIFKYREIYRHLNHTADIADNAMDFLLDILVKI